MASGHENCLKGWTERKEYCTDWRDDGYSKCESWRKNCKIKWIPIIGPALCKIFEWVCIAAVWIVNWVCHAINVITTFHCLVWETVLPPLSFLVGIFVKAVFSIPFFGALLREAINVATSIAFGVIGIVFEGLVCGIFGLCFPKTLRLCVIITHDGRAPVKTPADVKPFVDRMKQIYKDEANVIVHEHYSDGNSPNVDPECGGSGWLQDLWLTGTQYENSESVNCISHSFSSVIGWRSPIYAFVVKDIKGDDVNGCSLGPLTNYVVFKLDNAVPLVNDVTLAHEVGHACGLLLHSDDMNNVMYSDGIPGRNRFTGLQKTIIRGAKYVTYF